MKFDAELEFAFWNRDYNRVIKRYKQKSKSFVAGFWVLLGAQLAAATSGYYNLKDITGTVRSVNVQQSGATYQLNSIAAAGTATRGIVLGTGTTAVAWDDYKLESQIAHGTGSGQLSYGASSVSIPSPASGYIVLPLTRDFTNSSGGNVTVREAGVYSLGHYSTNNTANFCTVRDVLSTPQVIPNGTTVTVTYRFMSAV
jgi:hypothetical protein